MHEGILKGPFHFYLNILIKEGGGWEATFTAHQAQNSLHLLHRNVVENVPGQRTLTGDAK